MNPNYEYFMEHDLSQYAGTWVIIVSRKVVAHGPCRKMGSLVKRIRRSYPKEPLFIGKIS